MAAAVNFVAGLLWLLQVKALWQLLVREEVCVYYSCTVAACKAFFVCRITLRTWLGQQ